MKTILLSAVLLISFSTQALSIDQTYIDVPPERPDHQYIENLVRHGIIDIWVNFRPDDKITRAEFAKIIVLASLWVANDKIQKYKSFSDVKSSEWYWPFIESAKYFKLIDWYPDWTFKPWRNILRPEAIKIIMLSSGLSLDKSPKIDYRDWVQHQWYAKYAYPAFEYWIYKWKIWTNGLPQMIFDANHEITRWEMATYISKMIIL